MHNGLACGRVGSCGARKKALRSVCKAAAVLCHGFSPRIVNHPAWVERASQRVEQRSLPGTARTDKATCFTRGKGE